MSDGPVIADLLRRVAELEHAVEHLVEHLGVTIPPARPKISPAVRDLLARGKTMRAIAQYRRETGVPLVEAKRVIDALS